MPIYEYQCRKCGKIHEVTQKITDPPLTKCPDCGGKMEKLISLAGFQLKGGGWYKDGYSSARPESPKTESKQPSPSESPSPSKDAPPPPAKTGKSDPKPEKAVPRKPASKS
jgi:putative FmdB family regulatory protein